MEEKQAFPIGTIVYYGPDQETVTKIVASVITSREAKPISKEWSGEGVTTDKAVLSEIGAFFKEHQVQRVVMEQKVNTTT